MEDFKNLLTQYSEFINKYDGSTDTFALLNIGKNTLNKAKPFLSSTEYDTLRKSINDFYELQMKLKDADIQSLSCKSHLIGYGIYIEVKIVFIL